MFHNWVENLEYHQALKRAVNKSPIAYKNVLIMAKIVNIEKRLAFASLNHSACLLYPVKQERKMMFQQVPIYLQRIKLSFLTH